MRNRRGFILITVAVFIFVTFFFSMGLYTYTGNVYKQVGIKEVEYSRGYYAALAGLRYVWVLLADPEGSFNFINNLSASTPEQITISMRTGSRIDAGTALNTTVSNNLISLANELGITAPHDVILRIVEVNSSGGPYDVSATYNY